MNRKLSRTVLLITMITISTYIGGIFAINMATPSIQINYVIISNNNDQMNKTFPQNYSRRGIEEIDDVGCCGRVDVTPPLIICSFTNNSLVPIGATINLKIIDDNPCLDNIPVEALYHWDKDKSNTTVDDLDRDDIFEVAIPNYNGTHVLYVYAVDAVGNWSSAIFSFTIIPSDYIPTIDFITPSTRNEILTGMYVFRVNVTYDFGPINVKMQIDSSARLTMDYNETSSYYYRSYNVSELTNGYHWLKVTAVDINYKLHTVIAKINFTIIGGQETAIVSDPPEWDPSRSDLPTNLSYDIEAGDFLKYYVESENISFKVAVKDDKGMAAVDFTVYTIDNLDNYTGEIDIGNKEFTQSLSKSGSDGTWDIYQYTWDSTTSLDNYYLCEFEVQDTDEVANRMYIRVVLEVDNVEETTASLISTQSSTEFLLVPSILALTGSIVPLVPVILTVTASRIRKPETN